jgi:hypothetical protein
MTALPAAGVWICTAGGSVSAVFLQCEQSAASGSWSGGHGG